MRNVLVAAFVLSMLIHLLGVRLVHWSVPAPHDEQETTQVSKIAITHRVIPTPPPASPHPSPAASLAPHKVAHVRVVVPHIRSSSGTPTRNARTAILPTQSPTPTPSPSPRPSAEPKGGCVTPNAPAAVRMLAPQGNMPADLRRTAKNGVVTRVHLRLSETGAVLEAGILTSSGNDGQDQLVLAQAKTSVYSPALDHCKAVAGTYDFAAKFLMP